MTDISRMYDAMAEALGPWENEGHQDVNTTAWVGFRVGDLQSPRGAPVRFRGQAPQQQGPS